MLQDYLADVGDPARNARFWSEDLIYIGSDGRRLSKQEILEAVTAARKAGPGAKTFTHEAEDITVHLYGDVAVVSFRLLAHIHQGTSVETKRHATTGVFVLRNGLWRAVSWQTTDEPASS